MTTQKKISPASASEVHRPLDRPAPAALRTPAVPSVQAGAKAPEKSTAREPVQFRYLLAQWVAERRPDGWWIAKSWTSSSGEKPKWEGPFAFPQDASIAIARYLCAELSNRHQSKARFYRVKPTDPLFGLPAIPDLSIGAKRGGKS